MTESRQLEALNAKLSQCQARHREKLKLTAMLQETNQQVARANRVQKDAGEILRQAQTDVDALEGLSLTALFHTVLGVKEERLEKQRQAVVAAKLKRDEAVESIRDLETERQQFNEQWEALADADRQYQDVLREKSEYLQQSGHETARRLIEITEQMADCAANEKELYEALCAGELALAALQDVRRSLSSASNLGMFDLMGGGVFATMAKHSRLDTAQHYARLAQKRLLRFQKELSDVNQRLQMSLNIGPLTTFADYFFDGLIADWIVQSKISHAQRECDKTHTAVKSAVCHCQDRLREARVDAAKLARQKQELIEQA